VLRSQGIDVAGILFNGEKNGDTESVILGMSGLPSLGRIPPLKEVTPEAVEAAAREVGPHIRSLGII
jgi:dethiobiotin synthetase